MIGKKKGVIGEIGIEEIGESWIRTILTLKRNMNQTVEETGTETETTNMINMMKEGGKKDWTTSEKSQKTRMIIVDMIERRVISENRDQETTSDRPLIVTENTKKTTLTIAKSGEIGNPEPPNTTLMRIETVAAKNTIDTMMKMKIITEEVKTGNLD